jgi:hypothetical protein
MIVPAKFFNAAEQYIDISNGYLARSAQSGFNKMSDVRL